MPITQTATNAFRTGMLTASYNFNSDVFKIALYTANANLSATTSVYTSSNEVVTVGYTAGGATLTVTTAPTVGSGNVAYLTFADVLWSAAITARGALIYDVTNGNRTVCVLDFGADKTSSSLFKVQFPPVGPTSSIIRVV